MSNSKIISGRRTIGETSIDTRTIYGMLEKLEVGSILPYGDLSSTLGRDVRLIPGSICTAKRMALRELSAVFMTVRGVGLKRLNNSEIALLPESTISRVRSAVRREMQRQTVVVESELTNQERVVRNSRLSMLGALSEFSRPKTQKLIEATKPEGPLAVGRVIELFK